MERFKLLPAQKRIYNAISKQNVIVKTSRRPGINTIFQRYIANHLHRGSRKALGHD